MNVAVLGASADPTKYSHMAVVRLREKGHDVFPVHPSLASVEGLTAYPRLSAVPAAIDTLTIYVNPSVSSSLAGEILAARPRRIFFNPGAENPDLEARARAAGIETVTGCTLVALQTGRF